MAKEVEDLTSEVARVLEEEGVSCVAVQDDLGVRQALRHRVAGECVRVDHDVPRSVGDEDQYVSPSSPVQHFGSEGAERSALTAEGLGRHGGVRLGSPGSAAAWVSAIRLRA